MIKINLKFGETTISCETTTGLSMTNYGDLERSSPGFDMPITEIIGKVSSVNEHDSNVSFKVEGHTVSIGPDQPEWLSSGVRVKVGLIDGTVLLLDNIAGA